MNDTAEWIRAIEAADIRAAEAEARDERAAEMVDRVMRRARARDASPLQRCTVPGCNRFGCHHLYTPCKKLNCGHAPRV
jgi:hypothetical protein